MATTHRRNRWSDNRWRTSACKHRRGTTAAIAEYPIGSFIIYTDVGYDSNGANGVLGTSGWGVCVAEKATSSQLDVKAELFGPIETTRGTEWDHGATKGTNNTGEVTSIIEALIYIVNTTDARPTAILFESSYAANGVQGKAKAKKNIQGVDRDGSTTTCSSSDSHHGRLCACQGPLG